jgi:hypothetical protein
MLRNPFTVEMLRRFRNISQGPDWNGFHRDQIYRALMIEIAKSLPVSSFVETGTWRGDSTQTIAMRFPRLPIYTCEIVEKTYHLARGVLKKYPTVTQSLGRSDEFIGQLIRERKIGDFPFFFLDAHWQTYWPLRQELKYISDAQLKAIMVIDDFEVPGQPAFGFDIDGGGEVTAGEKCNVEYIRPSLGSQNRYRALFPKYGARDAYPSAGNLELRGHIALFQNADEQFEQFCKQPLIQQHYFEHAL